MAKTMALSIIDNTAIITFNRPDAMNSFNESMADELKEITEKVSKDINIRAVLLKGNGKSFMAGGDIRFFYDNLEKMPVGVIDLVRKLNVSILNLITMPKPVLACVHGSVAGAGISLMLACDLVIAANNTKFTLAYNGLGISPDGGASYTLPRLVGMKKAMELMLFSDIFDSEMALGYGLINWTCSSEELEEKTYSILKKLAAGPTFTYAMTKKLLNNSWSNSLEDQLEAEAFSFEKCSGTDDFKIGVKSFLNKEVPRFLGK